MLGIVVIAAWSCGISGVLFYALKKARPSTSLDKLVLTRFCWSGHGCCSASANASCSLREAPSLAVAAPPVMGRH